MINKKNKVVLIFVAIGILIFMYTHVKYEGRYNNLIKGYPLLNKKDSLSGIIGSKFELQSIGFRESGIVTFIKIKRKPYQIFAEETIGETQYGINEILSIGDSIFKESYSDSIKLIKPDGEEYLFIRRDVEFP